MELKINDLVAFATRRDPNKVKYIARVQDFSTRINQFAIVTDLGFGRFNWFDVKNNRMSNKRVSKNSRQLLINDEIPNHLVDMFVTFESDLLAQQKAESNEVMKTLKAIYDTDTENVGVYYCEGEYSVIKNGDGRAPIVYLSLATKKILDQGGFLHGNNLMSYKGRRYYNFKLPVNKKSDDIQIFLV